MEIAAMKRFDARPIAAVLTALALAVPAAQAETYVKQPETYQKNPCFPPAPGGGCWTPIPPPAGWICHWSMDINGQAIKSLLIEWLGGSDATLCKVSECTKACTATKGCIAVDIMKPGTIASDKCVCTLFSSVTSAKPFEEIRGVGPYSLSGWSCMRKPKEPPPPITDRPKITEGDRPSFHQDTMRPSTADPGRKR
jgi:hypothetical protein